MTFQLEPLDEITIDDQDLCEVEKFFNHFKEPVPDYLQLAIDEFKLKKTVFFQNKFRIAICRAMTEGHKSKPKKKGKKAKPSVFENGLFDEVASNSGMVVKHHKKYHSF